MADEPANEDQVARMLVETGAAPDAAVGWAVRRGQRWEVGEGRWSKDDPTASEDAPIFDLASLTKPMTALALHRSGIDPRQTRLGEVLEEARGTASEGATLEMLLAHRAGLAPHVPLFAPLVANPSVTEIDAPLALRTVANARRVECVDREIPVEGFPPVYSDLGPLLVGAALARELKMADAGAVIESFIEGGAELGTARALEARLGSKDFMKRVRPTEVVPWRGDGAIRGRVHDENAWALTREGGSGHAGMFGTLSAVLAFGAHVLDSLADERLDWMVRERPGGTLRAGFDGKSETGSSAGSVSGPRTFGHLGFTGTSLWIDPDAETVVVVLTNRVNPTRDNLEIRALRPRAHDALFRIAAKHR